jgi:hypothetical protein
MAQGEGLLRKLRQPLESPIFRRPTLTFVAAVMRRRMDAILLPGKLGAHKIRQLLGNLSRHKALTVVVVGVIGLALILLLLEVSVRRQLANEASDAAIDTVAAPSASPQKMDFGGAFPIQRTRSISLQSADLSGAPRATPSSDDVQTLGQAFREPVPLPRPRKPR